MGTRTFSAFVGIFWTPTNFRDVFPTTDMAIHWRSLLYFSGKFLVLSAWISGKLLLVEMQQKLDIKDDICNKTV